MEPLSLPTETPDIPAVGSNGLLCRIGWHKWKTVGIQGVLNPLPAFICAKCGAGRFPHWSGAEFRLSPQEMAEAMRHNGQSAADLNRKSQA